MPTLVIDCHYLGWQAKNSHRGLSFEEFETGVLFGFLSQILTLGKFFKSNSFIFAWDSKHSKRKGIFPGYKNRNYGEETKEEKAQRYLAIRQFKILRTEILPAIGFKNGFIQAGYEADDIIAKAAMKLIDEVIIVSADKDLYQLLFQNVRMWNPYSKKMLTRKGFQNEYGISPNQWPTVKQLGGCTSDTVPGLKGVGEKTAIKYLNGELKTTSKIYNTIKTASRKELRLYKKLVTLPYPKTKDLKLTADKFDTEEFIRICGKYGFESFLDSSWDMWEEFFKGEFTEPKRKVKVQRSKGMIL